MAYQRASVDQSAGVSGERIRAQWFVFWRRNLAGLRSTDATRVTTPLAECKRHRDTFTGVITCLDSRLQ